MPKSDAQPINMKKVFRNNGLSIVFFILFLFSLIGQMVTGLKEHNKGMLELGYNIGPFSTIHF